ncbi:F0F1-type ATP synthase, beta subunit [Synechococcus sp. PCC 7502]|uniref:F0F1 ATP synthase subunit B' n=1 Tax=Synechococcus sp. PCC 7502 TaxID=1173263 RepID=UPI00029FB7C1|nr:F0F1 ATP synthase subunit B' [Synechococcus sp. PCC 7502]AFY74732.1 F0F1-type ATP synthase, beta subunit [Synechococcus sp. PCC 7502]
MTLYSTPLLTVLLAVESAESSGGLFDFDATLPIMAAQILILVAVLNKIFFKPLTKAIDDRNDYVRTNIAGAKERLEKAKLVAAQYESELAETRKSSQALLLAAQSDANKIRAEQIAATLAESQAQVAAAKAEIEQQRSEAIAALDVQVDVLSRQILEKLLGNLVNS